MKQKGITLLLAVLLLFSAGVTASAQEPERPQPRWASISQITQTVYAGSSGATCDYYIRAYGAITKITATATLYEYKNGGYQYVSSWSDTYNNYYGVRSAWRATSGGSCKFVVTYRTYIGSTFQESVTVTKYG